MIEGMSFFAWMLDDEGNPILCIDLYIYMYNVKYHTKNIDQEPCDVPLFNVLYLVGGEFDSPLISSEPQIEGVLREQQHRDIAFGKYSIQNRWMYADYFVDIFHTKQMKTAEFEGHYNEEELKYFASLLV